MWVGSFAHLLFDVQLAQNIAGLTAAAIALFALFTTSGTPRKTLIVLGGCALLVSSVSGTLAPLWNGVVRASLFASFLASLFALSALVRMSSRIESIQDTFDSQPQPGRSGVLQFLGLVFAVPLAVGAVGVVSPLISSQRTGRDRVTDASWAMRGMGLAVLFSPFTVAMGVATSASDKDLPIGWLMSCGLIMALTLFLIPFFRGQCVLPGQLRGKFSRDLIVMLGPVLLLICLNMAIVFWVDVTPLQAAVLTVLPFSLFAAGLSGTGALRLVKDHVQGAWRHFDGEIAVFVASLCFAQAVANVPAIELVVASLAGIMGPTALIILSLLMILLLAMVGVHMVVTATLFVTVFSPSMTSDVQSVFLALAALLGWSLGTMIAPGSLAFVTACRVLQVPSKKVALDINLIFSVCSLLLFALAAIMIT
ncbi:hypothetical protein DBV39_02895 [Orrella marina]|uniref:Uncharacterized protein n=2 Tax=Orrella marina TaxID=2163011 RepID=A0A2R4XG97_9BURK|nr:hypothetical protein DBV39_02895 [Orrella marina]